MRLLLIDDDPHNLILLDEYLSLYGFDCLTTNNGMEGFALAKTHTPDLILTDLLMPDHTWNGYQTIYQFRNDADTQAIPIIAVTAAGKLEVAAQLGCDALFRRPFRMEALLQSIMNLLGYMPEPA